MSDTIYMDNAATTPAFAQVFDEVEEQLAWYGSIGRGKGQKSEHSTAIFEEGRLKVLDFVGADPDKYTAFYVGNTTDGINKLASALITSPDDIVLLSRMEHHANDIPWRKLCKTVYAEIDEVGRLVLEDVERLLIEHDGAIKFVSVTAASNVTGYVNDVHRIAAVAHRHGARIVVDGAQIAAHRRFGMAGAEPSGDIDYFVFSAHKMYAPFGSGAIIGLKSELERLHPAVLGGGNVDVVGDATVVFESAMPIRHDVGSPNYFGVVAMRKAMEVLDRIGFDYIERHEQVLMRKALDELTKMDDIILYGDSEKIDDRVGILLFNIKGMEANEVAEDLARMSGIAVRTGAFCAHPYAARLMGISDGMMSAPGSDVFPRMVLASFGVYNIEAELDVFIAALRRIIARKNADEGAEIPEKKDGPTESGAGFSALPER